MSDIDIHSEEEKVDRLERHVRWTERAGLLTLPVAAAGAVWGATTSLPFLFPLIAALAVLVYLGFVWAVRSELRRVSEEVKRLGDKTTRRSLLASKLQKISNSLVGRPSAL